MTKDKEWHNINDMYFVPGKKKEKAAFVTGVEPTESSPEPEKKPDPEYRITSLFILEPDGGFVINKPFEISGEVENLHLHAAKNKKILLYPSGSYKEEEDIYVPAGIEVYIKNDLTFRGECKYLFEPQHYVEDRGKPEDATWELYCRAEGTAAEKTVVSGRITFPRPQKEFAALRKGHYDEAGAKKYNKPEEGDGYITGYVVKNLQKELIMFRFLPKDSEDGFFGEKTDKAVLEFQDYSIRRFRMKKIEGKVFEIEHALDQTEPDGIVGEKTRKELDRWYREEWIKPVAVLYHGDYDDDGILKGERNRGGEDHHINTPVKDMQNALQKTGLYEECAIDGWFSDKTKEAVKEFQHRAAKGEFWKSDTDHTVVEIEEKLSGFQKGVLDVPTQEKLREVGEKKFKVPKEEVYGGFELQKGDNDQAKKWGGTVQEKEGGFVEELQRDLVKLGYWVSNANGTNGMVCSGTFDKYTKGAVITFQRENKLIEDNIIRKNIGNKIKECLKKENYQRPSHQAGEYGDFIQLKPSENYLRYFATYDSSNVLNDIWGTRETIKLIEDVAKEWKSKNLGIFMVGDISLYNGGKIPNHGSHKDGSCVDIDHNVCSIDKTVFNRENSLILADLFRKHGAKRILFNCKYITENCTITYPHTNHHNHFHIDTKESGEISIQENFLCDKCHTTNKLNCPHKEKEDAKDAKDAK